MHSLSSQSRSQFSCSACDRSFPLLSSLLTHQHSHTPEQRLLAEAEAEIVCPPSLSLSLPLPSSPGQGDKQQEAQGELHVNIIAVGQEQEEQSAKPTKPHKKTGSSKSTPAGGKSLATEQPLNSGYRAKKLPVYQAGVGIHSILPVSALYKAFAISMLT